MLPDCFGRDGAYQLDSALTTDPPGFRLANDAALAVGMASSPNRLNHGSSLGQPWLEVTFAVACGRAAGVQPAAFGVVDTRGLVWIRRGRCERFAGKAVSTRR